MTLSFFLPMNPPRVTAQTQGRRKYKSPELKEARQKLTAHIAQHRPGRPLEGPVRLVVKWIWPTAKKALHGTYKATRPDTDNLQKMLKDVLQDCKYFADDAQVASEVVEKFWDKTPGIYIKLEELE